MDCEFICAWSSGVFTVLYSFANLRRSERSCVMIKLMFLVNMHNEFSSIWIMGVQLGSCELFY